MRLTKREYKQPGTGYTVYEHELEVGGYRVQASRTADERALALGLSIEKIEDDIKRELADELVDLIYKAHA
jgi:hypothetical protein